MSEDVIAVWLIFGFIPAVIGCIYWVRHMRRDDIRRTVLPWLRQGSELPLNSRGAPDGKTLIELEKLRLQDRDKARAMYERLSLEKLEMLKAALHGGYKEEDLAKLDARLERIIGSDKLQSLLEVATESSPAAAPQKELPSVDISVSTSANGSASGAAQKPAAN
jgi:hypothetical protein